MALIHDDKTKIEKGEEKEKTMRWRVGSWKSFFCVCVCVCLALRPSEAPLDNPLRRLGYASPAPQAIPTDLVIIHSCGSTRNKHVLTTFVTQD